MQSYPARAVVDLDAIAANTAALVEHAGGTPVMAVVKADAYGHGAVPCARAALRGGAQWLGVAQLSEALALRVAGITAPVLTWLFAPGDDLGPAIAADVDLSVAAPWALDAVLQGAAAAGRPARIHLKVDTGLGRGGSAARDWPQLVKLAAAAQADGIVEVVGIWSHYAFADAPSHPTVRAQNAALEEAVEVAASFGVKPALRHLANSAATLTDPSARFDLVRPGLAVYGLSPVPQIGDPAHFGLRPAMTLTAKLVLVKDVDAGQGVSYGHTYTTSRPTTLGLVPLGYADGIPRHASNRGPVLVAGQRLQIAGRVCMDQFVLDLGGAEAVAGDEIVLFGPGDDGEPTAEDWARAADTISYEIVTRLGARVPRVYVGEGAEELALGGTA
ncbi:MAG TPA: alanine racemase [Nocardioidaceae bacterium]|jgi:alanine racemase|nr:alanine racemase [Nocardioidaceae bacterium]